MSSESTIIGGDLLSSGSTVTISQVEGLSTELQQRDTLDFRHQSSVDNPAVGYLRVYSKNDDNLYTKSSGGLETQITTAGNGCCSHWVFNTTITAPPAAGEFRLDNATPASATSLFIHTDDKDGNDMRSLLQTVQLGDLVYLCNAAKTNCKLYAIQDSTDQTTYFDFTVALESESNVAAFANGADILVQLYISNNPFDQNLSTTSAVEFKGVTTETVELKHIATPSAPSAGEDRLYTKTDDKLYLLNSAGTESLIGPLVASDIDMLNVGNPTYTNVQHLQDVFHSAGWTLGGAVTDNGDGTVAVTAGEGFIRSADTTTAPVYFCKWTANPSLALTDGQLNYIDVAWNGGTPIIIASLVAPNDHDEFSLATVYRDGTTLHITNQAKETVGDHAGLMIRRNKSIKYIVREENGGAIVSETGTRNFAITQGRWWVALTRFTTNAIDTSVSDTFRYFYNSASYVEVAGQTQIDNLQYDNAGTLTALGNNQYGVHWVYIGTDSDVYVIYGTQSYNLTDATDTAQPPSVLPGHFQLHATLIAKIIIQKSASTFTSITSAFTTSFTVAANAVNIVNGIGTDEAIVRFDTDGNTLQNSLATISDTGTLDTVDYKKGGDVFEGMLTGLGGGTRNALFSGNTYAGLTTGAFGNTNLGVEALEGLTSGNYNIGIGPQAGAAITTGSSNICIGNLAGNAIVSVDNNTLVGEGSGYLATSADNVGVGALTLYATTTGAKNVAVGSNAAFSGNYNETTCLGYNTATTGDYGIAIGAAAAAGNKQCVIGSATEAESITAILPGFDANCDLGSTTKGFKDAYLNKAIGTTAIITTEYPDTATSATTPAGYVISESTFSASSAAGWKCFDRTTSEWTTGVAYVAGTGVHLGTGSNTLIDAATVYGEWMQVYHPDFAMDIISYTISTIANNSAPQDWTICGSNDGTNFTTIETRSGETGWSNPETREYTLASTSTAYNYIRFVCTRTNGANSQRLDVSEMLFTSSSNCPGGETLEVGTCLTVDTHSRTKGNSQVDGFLKVGGSITSTSVTINSTIRGFLPPRMTTTERDAITGLTAGETIYNTTTNKLNFYNGSAWEAVTSA